MVRKIYLTAESSWKKQKFNPYFRLVFWPFFRQLGINAGLEIGHFWKNSNSRKLKTQAKNSNSSKKPSKTQAIKLNCGQFLNVVIDLFTLSLISFLEKCFLNWKWMLRKTLSISLTLQSPVTVNKLKMSCDMYPCHSFKYEKWQSLDLWCVRVWLIDNKDYWGIDCKVTHKCNCVAYDSIIFSLKRKENNNWHICKKLTCCIIIINHFFFVHQYHFQIHCELKSHHCSWITD